MPSIPPSKKADVEPDHQRPSIAYFCMEYGLDEVLKIYSGGLGMLAGDYPVSYTHLNYMSSWIYLYI